MSDAEEEYQLIIKYLDGHLDEAEQHTFDQLMESSEEFRQEVANTETIIASLKVADRAKRFQDVKDAFEKLDSTNRKTHPQNIRSTWMIGIAAAIALLLVGYFSFFNNDTPANSKQLYAQYFEPFPVEAGGKRNSDQVVLKGIELYSQSKYAEAIPLLKELLINDTVAINRIYLANAYLETNQFSEAEILLKEIPIEELSTVMDRYAAWYLSLSFIAQNKLEEAKKHLQSLSESNGYYQEEAIEILDSLKDL